MSSRLAPIPYLLLVALLPISQVGCGGGGNSGGNSPTKSASFRSTVRHNRRSWRWEQGFVGDNGPRHECKRGHCRILYGRKQRIAWLPNYFGSDIDGVRRAWSRDG